MKKELNHIYKKIQVIASRARNILENKQRIFEAIPEYIDSSASDAQNDEQKDKNAVEIERGISVSSSNAINGNNMNDDNGSSVNESSESVASGNSSNNNICNDETNDNENENGNNNISGILENANNNSEIDKSSDGISNDVVNMLKNNNNNMDILRNINNISDGDPFAPLLIRNNEPATRGDVVNLENVMTDQYNNILEYLKNGCQCQCNSHGKEHGESKTNENENVACKTCETYKARLKYFAVYKNHTVKNDTSTLPRLTKSRKAKALTNIFIIMHGHNHLLLQH